MEGAACACLLLLSKSHVLPHVMLCLCLADTACRMPLFKRVFRVAFSSTAIKQLRLDGCCCYGVTQLCGVRWVSPPDTYPQVTAASVQFVSVPIASIGLRRLCRRSTGIEMTATSRRLAALCLRTRSQGLTAPPVT